MRSSRINRPKLGSVEHLSANSTSRRVDVSCEDRSPFKLQGAEPGVRVRKNTTNQTGTVCFVISAQEEYELELLQLYEEPVEQFVSERGPNVSEKGEYWGMGRDYVLVGS